MDLDEHEERINNDLAMNLEYMQRKRKYRFPKEAWRVLSKEESLNATLMIALGLIITVVIFGIIVLAATV